MLHDKLLYKFQYGSITPTEHISHRKVTNRRRNFELNTAALFHMQHNGTLPNMELCFEYVHSNFVGISFPKEIITVNVWSPINAMQALRGGIFLPILNLRVVAPDTSPSGRKHITGIYLHVK